MEIKIKKIIGNRVIRLQGGGKIKEILMNEDFLKESQQKINLCFRGTDSSGIATLSKEEIDELSKLLKSKKKIIKDVKVFKEKKGKT